MKKIFISITAIFVLILNIAVPFKASAACDWSHGWLQYPYPQGLTTGFDYFQCKIKQNNDTEGMAVFFQFNPSYLDRVQKDDDSIIIELNNWVYCFQTYVNEYNWEYRTDLQITKFYLDLSSGKIIMYNGDTLVALNWITNDYHVFDYDSNLDMRDPIEVEVFPELCENFDYKGEYDGFSMELTQLQVDITNNTGYNYEYAILVQPKNSEMNVGLPNNSENNTFFWGSSPVTYALVKDEWIQRDAADAISAAFNALGYNPYVGDASAPITINTPSAWHYLPNNDTKREWIYYEQMQLKRGVDYTFKVYVYNITQNAPNNFSDDLVYPAYNNIELVYSKDFSVVKDTKFDADSVSNGAYSFDNTATLGSQFDKIKGYQEQDGNIKIFDNSSSSASGASGRVGSNSSYNNLISNSSSFLSLLKNVFNYLPDYVSMLLFGGLLCMVLVAIWRKL